MDAGVQLVCLSTLITLVKIDSNVERKTAKRPLIIAINEFTNEQNKKVTFGRIKVMEEIQSILTKVVSKMEVKEVFKSSKVVK